MDSLSKPCTCQNLYARSSYVTGIVHEVKISPNLVVTCILHKYYFHQISKGCRIHYYDQKMISFTNEINWQNWQIFSLGEKIPTVRICTSSCCCWLNASVREVCVCSQCWNTASPISPPMMPVNRAICGSWANLPHVSSRL